MANISSINGNPIVPDTDKSLSNYGIAADAYVTGVYASSAMNSAKRTYEIGDVINPSGAAASYRLKENGSSVSDSSYSIKKYTVTAGSTYWVKASRVPDGASFQFQNAWNVPTGANSDLVGRPVCVAYDGPIDVPQGASYIMICVSNDDSTSGLYRLRDAFRYMNIDSQAAISGDNAFYIESDSVNRYLYVTANSSWYVRSSTSVTISKTKMESEIGLYESPNGVSDCVRIPFGNSLYLLLSDNTLAIGNYSTVDRAKGLLLASVSTSGTLTAGLILRAIVRRTVFEINSYSDIPSYFASHVEEKISEINANAARAGKSGLTFAFITDQHLNYNSDNTPAIVEHLYKKCPLKYAVGGGDIIDVEPTKQNALDKIAAYVGSYSFMRHPLMPVIGNHDYNTETSYAVEGEELTISDFYGVALSCADGVTFYDDYYDYYITDEPSDTSIVFLETGVHNGSYHLNQNDALARILPSLASNVIIVGHLFCKTVDGQPALNANFNTLVVGSDAHHGLSRMDGGKKVRCIVTGHTHYDWTTVSSGFPVIVTTTNSYKSNASQNGSINELAFDVMTFDFANDEVNCVRVGRGSNRTIALKGE